eukprot:scaffold98561_cov17-Tisochrysis_lutea.AAC.2
MHSKAYSAVCGEPVACSFKSYAVSGPGMPVWRMDFKLDALAFWPQHLAQVRDSNKGSNNTVQTGRKQQMVLRASN